MGLTAARWPLRQRPDNGLSRGLMGLEYDRINISDSDSAPTLPTLESDQEPHGPTANNSSSVVSFTQFSPTCRRMPLPALSLWPGRQPCRPRLVDGRRGGGPSSVAPRSRNPPTGHRRDSPISSSSFSHGPPLSG